MQNQANNPQNTPRTTSARGFASMDQEKQRRIASLGGKAAHASGNAHEFDSKEAAEAGRKGGLASHGRKNRAKSASESAPTREQGEQNNFEVQSDVSEGPRRIEPSAQAE